MTDLQKQLIYKAKIPKFYKDCNFLDNYDTGSDIWQQAADKIRKTGFSNNSRFKIITGNHNTGKTFMMSCLAKHYCNKNMNVLYAKESDLLAHESLVWTSAGFIDIPLPLPSTYRMTEIPNKGYCHKKVGGVLLFDEVGCQSYIDDANFKSKDIHTKMNNYIDSILDHGVYVIFATNYPIEKLINRVGKKFWARIEKGGFATHQLNKTHGVY